MFLEHHIIMISEGSCDTENSALITGLNYISQNIHIENSCFKLLKYF